MKFETLNKINPIYFINNSSFETFITIFYIIFIISLSLFISIFYNNEYIPVNIPIINLNVNVFQKYIIIVFILLFSSIPICIYYLNKQNKKNNTSITPISNYDKKIIITIFIFILLLLFIIYISSRITINIINPFTHYKFFIYLLCIYFIYKFLNNKLSTNAQDINTTIFIQYIIYIFISYIIFNISLYSINNIHNIHPIYINIIYFLYNIILCFIIINIIFKFNKFQLPHTHLFNITFIICIILIWLYKYFIFIIIKKSYLNKIKYYILYIFLNFIIISYIVGSIYRYYLYYSTDIELMEYIQYKKESQKLINN